jgi:hypothetical protein
MEWDGHGRKGRTFWHWLRNATAAPMWFFDKCAVAIGNETGPKKADELQAF